MMAEMGSLLQTQEVGLAVWPTVALLYCTVLYCTVLYCTALY